MKRKLSISLSVLVAILMVLQSLCLLASADNGSIIILRPMQLPTELQTADVTISTKQPGSTYGTDAYYGEENKWSSIYSISNNNPEGVVTLSTAKSSVPYIPTLLKMNSTVVEYDRVYQNEDYSSNGVVIDFNLSSESHLSLKDGTGVMFYVKMPKNSKQMSLYLVTTGNSWNFRMKYALPYYALSAGGNEWQEMAGPWAELIDTPTNGFEGYIWIPKSTLASEDTTDWNTESIKKVQMQFGRYGGEDGAAYFSAPIVTLNNPLEMTSYEKAVIEGSTEEVDLFQSRYLHIRPMTLPNDLSESCTVISKLLPGNEYGTDSYFDDKWWALTGINTNRPAGMVTFSTCPNYMPFTSTNLKLDSTVVEYDRQYGSFDYARKGAVINAIFPQNNYCSLNGGTGVMMYVKMPKNSKQLALYLITANSGTWNMTQKVSLPYYTLAKGSNIWVKSLGQDGELLDMPYAGFEGYFFIPKSTLSSGDSNTDWNTDSISRIQLQFGRYGGEDGAAYFSAPIVTLNNPLSVENTTLAYTDNESETTDLFAGATYSKGDANQDGCVNLLDLVALKKMILQSKEETATADINEDTILNAGDLLELSKILLGV